MWPDNYTVRFKNADPDPGDKMNADPDHCMEPACYASDGIAHLSTHALCFSGVSLIALEGNLFDPKNLDTVPGYEASKDSFKPLMGPI